MHKTGLLNCILNLLFLYLKERNAENDAVSSQILVFLARADTCFQGEGRHNIFVRLEIANQLRGEGGEKGREGRKGYDLARKHTRVASCLSRLQGTTTGNLVSCLCESCLLNFSQEMWREETAWTV
jgi:hypothetical protein